MAALSTGIMTCVFEESEEGKQQNNNSDTRKSDFGIFRG